MIETTNHTSFAFNKSSFHFQSFQFQSHHHQTASQSVSWVKKCVCFVLISDSRTILNIPFSFYVLFYFLLFWLVVNRFDLRMLPTFGSFNYCDIFTTNSLISALSISFLTFSFYRLDSIRIEHRKCFSYEIHKTFLCFLPVAWIYFSKNMCAMYICLQIAVTEPNTIR